MSTLKCYVCKRIQHKEEFQTFKSCQSCRKKKSKKEPKETVPIETFAPLSVVSNTIEPAIESKTEWCLLSGKWIRRGEEQRLHKILLKKVHHQFHRRCAFPIHKYLTKYLMMDIRDV
jgi:hypothetical protein